MSKKVQNLLKQLEDIERQLKKQGWMHNGFIMDHRFGPTISNNWIFKELTYQTLHHMKGQHYRGTNPLVIQNVKRKNWKINKKNFWLNELHRLGFTSFFTFTVITQWKPAITPYCNTNIFSWRYWWKWMIFNRMNTKTKMSKVSFTTSKSVSKPILRVETVSKTFSAEYGLVATLTDFCFSDVVADR